MSQMNNSTAVSIVLFLLPLSMSFWVGNGICCWEISRITSHFLLPLLERGRENISESDPSLFLSSGLSIMWAEGGGEGEEEEEGGTAAKVHQIQPQVP